LFESLPDSDLDLLEPQLAFVTLSLRKTPERPNRSIDAVYFPEVGFASVVALQSSGGEIEVGLISREGMTGLPIVFGDHRSPHAAYVPSAGLGNGIQATELGKALQSSPSLRDSLLKFAQAFGVQTARTAICNSRCKLDVRLARWLLMARGRIGEDRLPLTQEFLSIMLGVRRAGVTEALHVLRDHRIDLLRALPHYRGGSQGHGAQGRHDLRHSRPNIADSSDEA
jgi:CRP-like cAMP-binding protein